MTRIHRLDYLESFVFVADFGSFSLAARSLHRSQSRVSVHVAELERSLGHVLLDRSRKPVRLTEAGERFLARARRVLRELDESKVELDRAANEVHGKVRIGALPSISAMLLPEVLRRMSLFYPGVEVETTERTSRRLLQNLVEGSIDLAIRSAAEVKHNTSVDSLLLWTEDYVAAIPQDHALATTPTPIQPAELKDYAIASTTALGRDIDAELRKQFEHWKFEPTFSPYCAEAPQTLLNFAKSGLCVAIVNRLAYASCNTEGLISRQIVNEIPARHVSLYWPTDRVRTPATQALFDTITSYKPAEIAT